MKKHLLKLMGILAISACAYAIPADNFGPPITEGIGQTGSSTEVRVTANVVDGIAVNEASPIDFGNLVRGSNVYTDGEVINQRTPGLVVFRAGVNSGGVTQVTGKIYASLNTNTIDLNWTGQNGTTGQKPGEHDKLVNVTITGMKTGGTVGNGMDEIQLENGQARRPLYASFVAYEKKDKAKDIEGGNLGNKQKLGSYLGTVIVSARYK